MAIELKASQKIVTGRAVDAPVIRNNRDGSKRVTLDVIPNGTDSPVHLIAYLNKNISEKGNGPYGYISKGDLIRLIYTPTKRKNNSGIIDNYIDKIYFETQIKPDKDEA